MSFTMVYNEQKNQILVKTPGLTQDDAADYIKQFEQLMKKVKPGFTGVTDVTESKGVLTPEIAAMLAPTGPMAVKAGQAGWAYVTKDPIWKMQLKRIFGRDFADPYDTYEEADAYLSSLGK